MHYGRAASAAAAPAPGSSLGSSLRRFGVDVIAADALVRLPTALNGGEMGEVVG